MPEKILPNQIDKYKYTPHGRDVYEDPEEIDRHAKKMISNINNTNWHIIYSVDILLQALNNYVDQNTSTKSVVTLNSGSILNHFQILH